MFWNRRGRHRASHGSRAQKRHSRSRYEAAQGDCRYREGVVDDRVAPDVVTPWKEVTTVPLQTFSMASAAPEQQIGRCRQLRVPAITWIYACFAPTRMTARQTPTTCSRTAWELACGRSPRDLSRLFTVDELAFERPPPCGCAIREWRCF
jgi:hypothetical protein